MAVAFDATLVAEGVLEGLAEGEPDVFDGVVIVDVGVAVASDAEAEAAVLGDVVEHVVEEAHAGDVLIGPAVEVEVEGDVGLAGASGDGGRAGRGPGLVGHGGDGLLLAELCVDGAEQGVVLVGRADGDAELVGEPVGVEVTDEDAAGFEVFVKHAGGGRVTRSFASCSARMPAR